MTSLLERFDKACKADYFLHYGTLLGHLRYQDILPWDDDLDVGVYDRDKLLQSDFQSVGLKIEPFFFGYKIFNLDDKKRFPFLDIFLYERSDGLPTNHSARKAFSDVYLPSDVYPLKRVKFSSIESWIPAKSNKLISSFYPDWRKQIVFSGSHRVPTGKYQLELTDEINQKISDYLKFLNRS